MVVWSEIIEFNFSCILTFFAVMAFPVCLRDVSGLFDDHWNVVLGHST